MLENDRCGLNRKQICCGKSQAFHSGANFGPVAGQKQLALAPPQLFRRAAGDKHADSALDLNQAIKLELLIGLGHGQRIGARSAASARTEGSIAPSG